MGRARRAVPSARVERPQIVVFHVWENALRYARHSASCRIYGRRRTQAQAFAGAISGRIAWWLQTSTTLPLQTGI